MKDFWFTIPPMPGSSITSMQRVQTFVERPDCVAVTGASEPLPTLASILALYGAKAVTTFWGGMGHL